jgi:anti-sigma factor RsiW
MSCSFYENLSPYCDGELDSLQAKEIEEHLGSCAVCQRELDYMLQIRNSLKQGAANTKAPSPLREKILGKTRQSRHTLLIARWNFAYVAPLAAMMLVAFILIFHYWPVDRDSFTDVVDILVKYHAVYGPGGKSLSFESSDSDDAALWLKRKLDLEFSVPNAAFAGYSLEGADEFEQKDRKFAYLKYQHNGKTIGYIIFKDSALSINLPETVDIDNIKLYLGKKEDTNFAVWKNKGFVHLILTTEDRSELIDYARRCIRFF